MRIFTDAAFTESKVIGQAGKVEEGAVAGAENQSQKLLTWDGRSNEWMPNTEIRARYAPDNYEINVVVYKDQPFSGHFGTVDDITSLDFARNKLAITPEFKQGNDLYVQRYSVPKGILIQEGTVGPQTVKSTGITYPGGANQTQIVIKGDNELLIPIGNQQKLK